MTNKMDTPVQQNEPSESWAWKEIRSGGIADFHKLYGKLDPKSPEGWGKDRSLGATFVRRLFHERTNRDEVPPEGVRIIGAWFPDGLLLPYGNLHRQLQIEHSRFEQPVDFGGLKTDGSLSLEGSLATAVANDSLALNLKEAKIGGSLYLDYATIKGITDLETASIKDRFTCQGANMEGELKMNALEVGQSLHMHSPDSDHISRFQKVDLTTANIKGQLALADAYIECALTMNSLEVGQDLLMTNLVVTGPPADDPGELDLEGANIKGLLILDGADIKPALTMDGIKIGQHVRMRGKFFKPNLLGANIKGQLVLNGASIRGLLLLDRAEIGTSLLLRGAFGSDSNQGLEASLRFVRVGALHLDGATCIGLDLSGAQISGELRVGSVSWPTGGRLVLRAAHAAVLEESVTGWPTSIEVEGFTYDRLLTGVEADDIDAIRHLLEVLKRDQSYSPQPYEQLASVFRKMGYPEKAYEILYEGRERARKLAKQRANTFREHAKVRRGNQKQTRRLAKENRWRYRGLSLLKWTIGYGLGLRYFRCLWWVAGFTLAGVIVLQLNATHINVVNSVVYSFQRLLPFAKLTEFSRLRLGSFATLYFYAQPVFGYVLASFLAAGLAGLTQKS